MISSRAQRSKGTNRSLDLLRRHHARLLLARVLTSAALFGALPYFVVLLNRNAGFSPTHAALVLGSVIVISRVASLPVGLLIDRIGADRLLMAATTTFAVA